MQSNIKKFTLATILLATLLAAGYYLFTISGTAESSKPLKKLLTETQTPVEPLTGKIKREPPPETVRYFEPAPAAGHIYNVIQPPATLEGSDKLVVEALQYLSPTLTQWVVPDGLVQKWVLAVDKLADGKLPKRYRPIDFPMSKFEPKRYGEISIIDDKVYTRLTPLIAALTEIDIALLAQHYQSWKPLLEQAYSQQGEPGTFEERLISALDNLLAVSSLEEKGVLIRPHVLYIYQEDKLEKATDVEKLCWRMGKNNTLLLQSFARELRSQITVQ